MGNKSFKQSSSSEKAYMTKFKRLLGELYHETLSKRIKEAIRRKKENQLYANH